LSVWADEGGEIVFLYNEVLAAKRTIQIFRGNSLGVGVPWRALDEKGGGGFFKGIGVQ
jgi:hypothetical protein